jgi:lipid II:glycine glycyltransferase (peptidoglycan interpeptide bridge formation enzyme)
LGFGGLLSIICRKAKVEDKEQWNNVVKESLNGTFYHTWEWNEVMERGLNYEALPVVVEDEKEKKLVGIFPFFIRNFFEDFKINKYCPYISNKFQIGCSPHHKTYSFGGPCVLSSTSNSEDIYSLMFNFIDNFTKKRKSIFDNLIYPYHNCLDSMLVQNGYTKTTRSRKTAVINLEKSLDELCKDFKKQFSKDIRRASRSGVILYESQNYNEDIDLYHNQFQKHLIDRIIEKTGNNYKKVSYASVPYSYFEKIHDILFPEKKARMFFVEYNGIKIGAQINFYHKDTMYLGHTSVLRGYNELNASKLLIWHSIKDGKTNNFKNFDLSGLHSDESHGQYLFKMGFNGQIREIEEYKKSYRYKRIRYMKKIIDEFKRKKAVLLQES